MLLADHENLWEVNRQIPAITLGAWILVGVFLACRWALATPGTAWHTSRRGQLAAVAMVGAVVMVLLGSLPRSDGTSTCGPVLYEWKSSNANCVDELRPIRVAMLICATVVVTLIVVIRRSVHVR